MLAGALLLGIGANPANAQTYRPDAEGYPCARTAQLAVVQSETGFSIREKADRAALPGAGASAGGNQARKLAHSRQPNFRAHLPRSSGVLRCPAAVT
jgi:hypothetical protein